MIERICQACGAANGIESEACSQCERELVEHGRLAAPLAGRWVTAPARRAPAALARLRGQVPAALRQAARPVALGLAAVALELGASLLQRRLGRPEPGQAGLATRDRATAAPAGSRRVVIGQRVTEEYEQGQLRRRVVEQFISRGEP